MWDNISWSSKHTSTFKWHVKLLTFSLTLLSSRQGACIRAHFLRYHINNLDVNKNKKMRKCKIINDKSRSLAVQAKMYLYLSKEMGITVWYRSSSFLLEIMMFAEKWYFMIFVYWNLHYDAFLPSHGWVTKYLPTKTLSLSLSFYATLCLFNFLKILQNWHQ